MTIFFTGSEREALSSPVAGTYNMSTDGTDIRSPYARAACDVKAGYYEILLDVAQAEIWFHAALGATGFGEGAGDAIVFMDASNNVIAKIVGSNPTWFFRYWDGTSFVTLGSISFATTLPQNVFDVHIKKDGSSSIAEAFYNAAVMGASGDPVTLFFGDIAKIRLARAGYGGTTYSEVVVSDEPTVQWNVWTRPPTAEGTDTDGIGTYADVDEITIDTADFVQLNSAGEKHSFLYAALSTEDFIRGVAVAANIRRVDGTGPQSVRPYLIIGGVRHYGTTFALTTGFANYEYVWNINPATGTDWTTAEVNTPGLEMGWEAVA